MVHLVLLDLVAAGLLVPPVLLPLVELLAIRLFVVPVLVGLPVEPVVGYLATPVMVPFVVFAEDEVAVQEFPALAVFAIPIAGGVLVPLIRLFLVVTIVVVLVAVVVPCVGI
ncbi:hypothetical protein [Nonomuraea maritima]|uniref:hypothetical protein n=1 Tax=Nonomuraea maritima TaxID=683260 RepID=UPI00371423CD